MAKQATVTTAKSLKQLAKTLEIAYHKLWKLEAAGVFSKDEAGMYDPEQVKASIDDHVAAAKPHESAEDAEERRWRIESRKWRALLLKKLYQQGTPDDELAQIRAAITKTVSEINEHYRVNLRTVATTSVKTGKSGKALLAHLLDEFDFVLQRVGNEFDQEKYPYQPPSK
jgi:hypothetical protein